MVSRIEHRGGGPLGDVAGAVELAALAALPQLGDLHAVHHQLLADDGVAAAHAGKAGGLGEGAELNSALLRPGDFKDAVGQARLGDKGLVGGVKQDDGLLLQGVVHPGLQLLLVVGGAGGVVGGAQVDDVRLYALVGQGQKAVLLVGVHVGDVPAGDDVGIHIHRVHRVGHQHGVVPSPTNTSEGSMSTPKFL